MNPVKQLEALLCETTATARMRQQTAFDEAAHNRRRIVIFGVGRLGRAIQRRLKGKDLEAVAFTDNNPDTWGKSIGGLPVLSPSEAAQKYARDTAFVVAVWHPSSSPLMTVLLDQLRALGCWPVPFPVLFWRYSTIFLPYFFWDLPEHLLQQSDAVAAAFELFNDDASRHVFAAQLQLRLKADFACLGLPSAGKQYFPGLFSLSDDECFIDCGSYTGNTIQAFISSTNNCFRKVIAFEADPAVMGGLQTFVKSLGDRVHLHNAVVGARSGFVRFSGDGTGGGRTSTDSGAAEVSCVRLDDSVANEHPSFIKMDIEGSELDALEGARQVIARDRPVLAVCGYHRPDHLWRIPRRLKQIAPNSQIFLRSHCADGLDTVCYAIPSDRQLQVTTTADACVGHQPKGSKL